VAEGDYAVSPVQREAGREALTFIGIELVRDQAVTVVREVSSQRFSGRGQSWRHRLELAIFEITSEVINRGAEGFPSLGAWPEAIPGDGGDAIQQDGSKDVVGLDVQQDMIERRASAFGVEPAQLATLEALELVLGFEGDLAGRLVALGDDVEPSEILADLAELSSEPRRLQVLKRPAMSSDEITEFVEQKRRLG
jgi:hypothetical protein